MRGPPFLLKTLPLMMTGDPGANVCSSFFFRPQPPNIEVTLLPFTLAWLLSPSWEAVDLHTPSHCCRAGHCRYCNSSCCSV